MLSIIVAFDNNYVIGKDNKLLWHIPEDLKRFKELTTDKTIIMGRKTFESLPSILSNRQHIIITKNKDFTIEDDRVSIFNSIEDVISLKNAKEEYFIIGGGEIYKLFLPYCKKLYITKIKANSKGDTYFPKIDFNKYHIKKIGFGIKNSLSYSFLELTLK